MTQELPFEHMAAAHCSPQLRRAILRRVPLFAALDEQALGDVDRRFHERGYTAGETIYYSGDAAQTLYVVATGRVKLLQHALRQDVLLDFVAPGEMFGTLPLMGDRIYTETAQAHTDCCLLEIYTDDFQTILDEQPSVARALLSLVSHRLMAARDTIRQLSASPVESRIAAALLTLERRFNQRAERAARIQLPLTRQDLADMTGAKVETVSRVMSQFRKNGLIQSGRGWVKLLDRERLAAIAEERAA